MRWSSPSGGGCRSSSSTANVGRLGSSSSRASSMKGSNAVIQVSLSSSASASRSLFSRSSNMALLGLRPARCGADEMTPLHARQGVQSWAESASHRETNTDSSSPTVLPAIAWQVNVTGQRQTSRAASPHARITAKSAKPAESSAEFVRYPSNQVNRLLPSSASSRDHSDRHTSLPVALRPYTPSDHRVHYIHQQKEIRAHVHIG